MNTGTFAILAAFGASGAALAAYLTAWAGRRPTLRIARTLYMLMTAALGFAALLLMGAILTDDFSVVYVTQYSSRELPALYKISAFWAGQQGTVLLWTLLQAAVGLFLAKRKDDWEPATMSIFLVPQSLLLLLLVALNPFKTAAPLADGSGLNPLLRDPWMAIHPPIVFIGYASLAAPFALAVAAMAMKRSDGWVQRVLPWTLLSVMTLGAGVFIGGFWAYKVLGWGGYWGWDPVENSSLAPWLAASALIHALLAQRSNGALKRSGLALAAGSYVLALYSTYLTRSGVLSNFSVHSFADGGIEAYLILTLAICAGLPFVVMAARWRSLRPAPLAWDLSLQSVMPVGILLLMVATAVLVVGTSWPILSTLAGSPSNPGPGFYNSVSLPIGIGLALTLAAAPLMGWLPSKGRRLARWMAPGAAAGLLAMLLPPVFGLHPKGGLLTLLLLGAGVAALVASLIRVGRQLAANPALAGAGIAHAGVALVFIGIVTTSAFDHMESAVLETGRASEVLGHRFTLDRYVPSLPGTEPHFNIDVTAPSGESFVATPIMFAYSGGEKTMARPYIKRDILGDLYVSPASYDPGEPEMHRVALAKDQTGTLGPVDLTFKQFESHAPAGESMRVGARVEVARGEESAQFVLELTAGPQGVGGAWTEIPLSDGMTARLDGMQVESRSIHVSIQMPAGSARGPRLSVDVSTKPLVGSLWLGMTLIGAGSGLAALQRRRELAVVTAGAAAAGTKARKRQGDRAPAIPAGMIPLSRREARRREA